MKEDLSNILIKHGFKITLPRLAILSVFSHECKPVNAEIIHKKLKKEKINIVTIYRTLASFELLGILKRVELQKDSTYYELAGHHHHHIICTNCGFIESFDECDILSLSKKTLAQSSQFKTINNHSLELFGVCNTCIKD